MGSFKGSFEGPFKGIYRDSIRVFGLGLLEGSWSYNWGYKSLNMAYNYSYPTLCRGRSCSEEYLGLRAWGLYRLHKRLFGSFCKIFRHLIIIYSPKY